MIYIILNHYPAAFCFRLNENEPGTDISSKTIREDMDVLMAGDAVPLGEISEPEHGR